MTVNSGNWEGERRVNSEDGVMGCAESRVSEI